MTNIIHKIGILCSPDEVYKLLTTDKGLSQWWTSTTYGAGGIGSVINFKFNDVTVLFRVDELQANKYVKWTHAGDMPDAWAGTEVSFELSSEGKQTYVLFKHSDWKEQTEFMGHCSTKWAVFLLSLKAAIETGEGRPHPNDTHIDHD